MKKILKVTATTFLLLISVTVFAQRAVSLRQFESLKQAYRTSPDPEAAGLDDGEDITYMKDVNNELDQFTGTWKGTYNNRDYELTFVKKVSYRLFSDDPFTIDLLKGWVTVKDQSGNIIYSNTNKPENLNGFTGVNFQLNTTIYTFNFTANCYNGSGTVFLSIKKDGRMELSLTIDHDLLSNDCPNGFTPVLPISPNQVILTKQP